MRLFKTPAKVIIKSRIRHFGSLFFHCAFFRPENCKKCFKVVYLMKILQSFLMHNFPFPDLDPVKTSTKTRGYKLQILCTFFNFRAKNKHMSIVVKNLSKAYKGQPALKNVSFRIDKGEVVGFLGPNGAGKSTLMKILTTYLSADEGRAWVNGHDVMTEARQVQRSIGYLPEHNPLYLEMYVKEYLMFISELYGVPKGAVSESIQQVGLEKEAAKKIGQLSKGYRQRVGLAAALLHHPEVLILDEPTTGLDPNQLLEIRRLIREIGKDRTILLSTHIMKEVESVCGRVLIINKGELVADKTLNELREGKEQIIEVEFDYRVEEAFLLKIPHVTHVKNLTGFVYEITFSHSEDMRPAVFDFAHDNKLKTLQLSRKNKNLESLFTELTGP